MDICKKAIRTTSPLILLVSQVIAPENEDRRGLMLYNNSANSVYITFGLVSTGAACSIIIPTFANWAWAIPGMIYTGPIAAIRNSGTGAVIVTEFT